MKGTCTAGEDWLLGFAEFFKAKSESHLSLLKVCRVINKQCRAQVQYSYTTSKEFGITTEEMKSLSYSLYTFYKESYCGGRSQTIIRLAITQREENA